MRFMRTRTTDYLDAIEHLPDGATLIFQDVSWDEYERLLEERKCRHLRVSYDRGILEVMSPLPEHEHYARVIDLLVYFVAEKLDVKLQSYGAAIWKRKVLGRGVQPDSCYYVANADRVIGKRKFDLDIDPPPDIVVEIDITTNSLRKFPIYAALLVPEIWQYDGEMMQFYELSGAACSEISESRLFPGLGPQVLVDALEQSKTVGQTEALAAFRQHSSKSR
jgi:Uma2 family endonuclease